MGTQRNTKNNNEHQRLFPFHYESLERALSSYRFNGLHNNLARTWGCDAGAPTAQVPAQTAKTEHKYCGFLFHVGDFCDYHCNALYVLVNARTVIEFAFN